jgi:hypothetical protein
VGFKKINGYMNNLNNDLKHTLIKQYSKLSYQNPFELMERIKQKEWWEKETYKLKVQSNVAKIGFWFIVVCFVFLILFRSAKGSGQVLNSSLPILSVISIVLFLKTEASIKERVRLFAIMQLTLREKEKVVDSIL